MPNTNSVTDFIQSGINHGGVRPNRFRVLFNVPAIAGGTDARKLALLTQGAQIPGGNIGEAVVPYMGREAKLAGDVTINPWTTTITLDTLDQYYTFVRWQNAIMGTNSNVGVVTPAEYMGSASVEVLDRDGSTLDTIEVALIWPTTVNDLEFNHGTNNAIGTVVVTFSVNDVRSGATK